MPLTVPISRRTCSRRRRTTVVFEGSPETVGSKAAQHAKNFNFLYSRLCDLYPQYGLPDIVLQILSAAEIIDF